MLIHGIPSKKIILKEGDILTVDMGNIWQGYQVMQPVYAVGTVSPQTQRLIETTEACFYAALEGCEA